MDIPHQKSEPHPITGRSSYAPGEAGAVTTENGARSGETVIDDVVFERPSIAVTSTSSRSISTEAPSVNAARRKAPVRDADLERTEEARRKNPLERRTSGQPLPFKRVIRPRTALAASAAADESRAESHASLESVDHGAMQFGKIHSRQATPEYRPNRLFRVLDGIYTNSPLRWLDVIESRAVRVFAVTSILGVLGVIVMWKFYDTLLPAFQTGGKEQVADLTAEQRMERGRQAVREFLAARTIEARLPLVMDPSRAEPRMRQFYESMKGVDPKVSAWEVGAPRHGNQGSWLPFTFDDGAGRKVTVVLGETENGCLVDWENFVAFGDMPWADYGKTRPATSQAMRVRARQSDTYTGAYPKENWQAYDIEHRSGGLPLVGYASRAGRTIQALGELVKDKQWRATQLYLQFEAGAAEGSPVVIQDIVRSRWQDENTSWTGQ